MEKCVLNMISHFEYLVILFRIANMPVIFQAFIEQTLDSLIDITCIVYMDDILIFSAAHDKHLAYIQKVLEHLHSTQLYVKLSKCYSAVRKVSFLGFVVTKREVSIKSLRVQAITEWLTPKSVQNI